MALAVSKRQPRSRNDGQILKVVQCSSLAFVLIMPDDEMWRHNVAKRTLPCIACGRELKQVVDDASENQPYLATEFKASGHYGSTAYDPMDGHYIVVNICDICLSTHPERVLEGRDRRPVLKDGAIIDWAECSWKPMPWRVEPRTIAHTIEEALADFGILDPADPDPECPGAHGIKVTIEGAIED